MRKTVWTGLLLFLCVSVMGVAQDKGGRLQAVATTTMVADLVRQIGGDSVEVTGLMGAGVDPHLYKPTPRDITALQKADVIFYSGLMLEGRMSDVFNMLSRQGRKVYAVSEKIPQDRLLEPPEFQGHWDPHVWGDVEMWLMCVDVVEEGLIATAPARSKVIKERAGNYRKELIGLHQWAKKRAAEIPAERRVLITSHDAFNYFGRAYGFEVVGVQGISTVTEAGLADITKTVDFIKKRKVKAIFVESSVPPHNIKRISQDSGAKVGGELFSDALGTSGQIEKGGGESYDVGTYIGMIRHNINTVVEALK